jgi:putative FmdB family regulatory protein
MMKDDEDRDGLEEQLIYLYRCDECGLTVEEEHRMGDAPRTSECPICHEVTNRIYTAPAVHYSGEGWAGSNHGTPTPDERAKQPGAQEYDDLLED